MRTRTDALICLGLIAASLAVFGPAVTFDFVNYDDPEYVLENRHVTSGVTLANVVWAFTHAHSANWHPLTWISHMVDCQLFGLNPAGHHLTSVLLHAGVSVLLFLWLADATSKRWPSALVAALFALHPLRVESVAWISERKDVLCALFWMAATYAYVRYARTESTRRMVIVTVFFALGLLSKPMIVTLPFTLLLLDAWPLRRFDGTDDPRLRRCVTEKLPLFAMAALSAVVTYVVQRDAGAVATADSFPLAYRVANAFVSYAAYLRLTVWPSGLAPFYPPLAQMPLSEALMGLSIVVAASVAILWSRRPPLMVGWMWFVGVLVPVIGFIKQGEQAMADRFTYVPHVGLLVAIVWGVSELLDRFHVGTSVRIALAALALAPTSLVASLQVRYWQSSQTLFTHALAVTRDNYLAHLNLGSDLMQRGELTAAVAQFEQALALHPNHPKILLNLCGATNDLGQSKAALPLCERAVQLDARSASAQFNLGLSLAGLGRSKDAQATYGRALEIDPGHAKAHNQLGLLLADEGKWKAAVEHYEAALKIKPDMAQTYNNLAIALEQRGDIAGALNAYAAAIRLLPNEPLPLLNRGILLAEQSRSGDARIDLERALALAQARGLTTFATAAESRLKQLP